MKFIKFLDLTEEWGVLSMLDELFYWDYMYLRETEMLLREEFITHIQKDFLDGEPNSTNCKILYENKKVLSWEYDFESPQGLRRVTLTCLKKDGKL